MMAAIVTEAAVPLRRSIRGALYVIAAAMAVVTLLACGIGAFSAGRLGALVDRLVTSAVPQLQATLSLAQAGAETAAAAPSLATAVSETALKTAQADLTPNRTAMEQGLAALTAMPGNAAAAAGLTQTDQAAQALLTRIVTLQQSRIQAAADRAKAVAAIAAAHHDITAALGPVIDDAAFDLTTALSPDDGTDAKAMAAGLADARDNQLETLQNASALQADVNLLMGLLTAAATAPSWTSLEPLSDQVTAALGRTTKALEGLGRHQDVQGLRANLDLLAGYATGARLDVFALRGLELELASQADKALAENRQIAARMGEGVQAVVANAHAVAAAAGADGRTAITWANRMLLAAAVAAVIAVVATILLGRRISRPIVAMTAAMRRLAGGDLGTPIPVVVRKDEVGQMADALDVFRQNARAARALQQEAEHEHAQKARRQAAMDRYTQDFGTSAAGVMENLARSAESMRAHAADMSAATHRVRENATLTAEGAAASAQNLDAVAAAVGELSSSINEISAHVERAAQAAHAAVERATATDARMVSMTELAERVGEIVRLINDIAARTNLLALNATIEAARAGDAGKGFAVVAGEVKALATQTARATGEISTQIAAIRSATVEAADAVRGVTAAIGQVEAVATAISAAVEEQAVVTRDIATSIQQVTTATLSATTAMQEVAGASERTDAVSSAVLAGADTVSQDAATLRGEVTHFLQAVANTDQENQRRYERLAGNGAEVVLHAPDRPSQRVRINDISRGGVSLQCDWWPGAGVAVQLDLPGGTDRMAARTVRSNGRLLGLAFSTDDAGLHDVDRVLAALHDKTANDAVLARPAAAA